MRIMDVQLREFVARGAIAQADAAGLIGADHDHRQEKARAPGG